MGHLDAASRGCVVSSDGQLERVVVGEGSDLLDETWVRDIQTGSERGLDRGLERERGLDRGLDRGLQTGLEEEGYKEIEG